MDIQGPQTADIDVIVPVYNGQGFIIQALESAAGQTVAPRKIIVVDDGSTDITRDKVLEFQKKSPILVEYVYKNNGGPNSARNAGLKISRASFVAFLDGDDVWIKTKLAAQLLKFQSNEFFNLGLVYCGYEIIDAQGTVSHKYYIPPFNRAARGGIFKLLLKANIIYGSASGVLIKRECFSRIGYFDEQLRVGEDWDMWLRIAEVYDIDYVDEILVQVRKHYTNAGANQEFVFTHELDFYKKWVPYIFGRFAVPKSWARHIAYLLWRRMPKLDFFTIVKSRLSPKVRKILFSATFGNAGLYASCYPFMALFDLIRQKGLLKKAIKKLSESR
jgi:glycosyltransferase involved in cell wall biosynthesis